MINEKNNNAYNLDIPYIEALTKEGVRVYLSAKMYKKLNTEKTEVYIERNPISKIGTTMEICQDDIVDKSIKTYRNFKNEYLKAKKLSKEYDCNYIYHCTCGAWNPCFLVHDKNNPNNQQKVLTDICQYCDKKEFDDFIIQLDKNYTRDIEKLVNKANEIFK